MNPASERSDPFARRFNGDARYCAWRNDRAGQRVTKRPYKSLTTWGKSNDRSTWLTRNAAEQLARDGGFDGIGIYLGDNADGSMLVGIDLDTCRNRETGTREAWADEVIRRFKTYTEVSPSGTGYKLYSRIAAPDRKAALGLLDRGGGERGAQWKRQALGDHPPAIEFYAAGRFFALTFKPAHDSVDDIGVAQLEDLRWLIKDFGPKFAGRRNGDSQSERTAQPSQCETLAARGQAALESLQKWAGSYPKLKALLAGDFAYLGTDKSRSAADFALVGFCKDFGLSKEEARAAVYRFPHGAGAEKLDDGDARYFERCWNRVRSDQAQTGDPLERTTEPLSEDKAALMFERRFAGKLLFDCDAASWLCWDGVHWERDRTRRAFHWSRELARELASERTTSVRVTGGKTSFASGVERFAQATPEFARVSDDFDRDPFFLGTPGGTVDLRTGTIRAPNPGDCITRITGVEPADMADCPLWRRFLTEATGDDEDLIGFLQRWTGYCLTGDTREHALVFMVGSGGNGKTVFLRAIAEIMGDYAVTAAMDAFEASKNARHPTDLAMLRGARLVTASETEEGRAWAESRIKAITGGDPITARFMRQDFFTYVPQFKLTIVGNHIPILTNVDDAARRRFNIIPFNHKPKKPDPTLADKLRPEYPAILRWMIEGCLEWQRVGLNPPSAVSNATADYFADQDLFQQWLDECCDVKMGFEPKFERASDLYASWQRFAEGAGERGGSRKSFAQELRKRGFKPDRTGAARFFRFVSLKPSQPVTGGPINDG